MASGGMLLTDCDLLTLTGMTNSTSKDNEHAAFSKAVAGAKLGSTYVARTTCFVHPEEQLGLHKLNYRWFSFSCLSLFFVCFEVSPIRLLMFLLLCSLFSMLHLSFFFSDASCLTLRVNLLRPRSPFYGCILVANTYFWVLAEKNYKRFPANVLQIFPFHMWTCFSFVYWNLVYWCFLRWTTSVNYFWSPDVMDARRVQRLLPQCWVCRTVPHTGEWSGFVLEGQTRQISLVSFVKIVFIDDHWCR